MVKTKLTFDEELERRQILEQIGNELEAVRSLLYEMAKYYVPQTYDIENSTNKQLIKKLDKIQKVEGEIIEFREKHIPDEIWYMIPRKESVKV